MPVTGSRSPRHGRSPHNASPPSAAVGGGRGVGNPREHIHPTGADVRRGRGLSSIPLRGTIHEPRFEPGRRYPLTAAANAYQASAAELSAIWQDRHIPLIWAEIAGELDLAAYRIAQIAAVPGRRSAPRSRHSRPIACGATPRPATCRAAARRSTARSSGISLSPTPAGRSSPSPTSRCSAMIRSLSPTGS